MRGFLTVNADRRRLRRAASVLRRGLAIAVAMMAVFSGLLTGGAALAETPADPKSENLRDTPSCTLALKIDGAVGPGSLDYLEQAFREAEGRRCRSILMLINSPGGALVTTRRMVEKILASPIPVLCLVSPSGGHAGSAGAILLLACHVSGAEPATNIGAATPIDATGAKLSDDLRAKLIQDTVAWVTGLAKLRGRNVALAEKIVTEAKAVDSEVAAQAMLIDFLSTSQARFLDQAEGRRVKMSGDRDETVRTGALATYDPSWRARFLQIVGSPELAYLIFMASLALLYFEITHTGLVVPGVVGGIGLVLSLVAFHHLDVWWGGAALIALGLAFMIGEAFLPSHGALGVGGLVAFGFGSLFLYDRAPGAPPILSYVVVVATCAAAGAFMFGLSALAFRTRRLGPALADIALLGRRAEVVSLESPSLRKGKVSIAGEFWSFKSESDLRLGDIVEVLAQEGLTLTVRPFHKES